MAGIFVSIWLCREQTSRFAVWMRRWRVAHPLLQKTERPTGPERGPVVSELLLKESQQVLIQTVLVGIRQTVRRAWVNDELRVLD